jgi:hypothetical protein
MMAASSYRRDFLLIEEPSDNTMKLEKNKWGRVVVHPSNDANS